MSIFRREPEMLVLGNMMNTLFVQTEGQFDQRFLNCWLEKFIEEVKKHPKLLKSKFTAREFLIS
jgi:hypothetical protein